MNVWLKVLCVALIMYVVVFSFWHPMAPGGLEVSCTELHPGKNEFVFTGYGSHFKRNTSSLKAFITSDSSAKYCGEVIEVLDDARARFSIMLPDTISSGNFNFFANNDEDGFLLVEPPIKSEQFVLLAGYDGGSCKVEVKNEDYKGFAFPYQPRIIETIRNLMFHVPLWFTMFALMFTSFYWSIRVLNSSGRNAGAAASAKSMKEFDTKAAMSASTGMFFCVMGLVTGSLWARFTWGDWWTTDPQLNGAMAVFLMYIAYFILRSSTADGEKKARLAAIFNIFSCVMMFVLLMVMPRFVGEGLHPGKSGNPAFSSYDLDSSLRTVFYPAVVGFILLGYWLFNINLRIRKLQIKNEENE
jgi:heme exporter protein C